MAYIHHLRGAEFREWSANRTLLIAPDNTVHRDATHQEVITDLPVEEDGIVYQLQRSRERMASEWFAEHPRQHIILRMPNGQLKHVNNPDLKVTRTRGGGNRLGPAPDICQCKPWGDPHPGRHHAMCPHNRTAPKEEQALEHIQKQVMKARVYGPGTKGSVSHGVIMDKNGASVLPDKAVAPPVTAAPALRKVHGRGAAKGGGKAMGTKSRAPLAVDGVPVTPPDQCSCASYAGSTPGHHHQVCVRREAWERYLNTNPEIKAAHLQALTAPVVQDAVFEPLPADVSVVADNEQPLEATVQTMDAETSNESAPAVDPSTDGASQNDVAPQNAGAPELEPSETGYYLVDVDTQKVARAADADEVDTAMAQTVPLLKLQGKSYLVVDGALLVKTS